MDASNKLARSLPQPLALSAKVSGLLIEAIQVLADFVQ
jgi:hypothetical protein